MTPLISIIIPCYNQGAFVEEAVESVLAQTFRDFEILLLDDGSDDAATQELLANATWPRTTVFRTANQGLARARNYLLARARGTYVCALDADDKLHPRYLESTLDALRSDPELAFASSRLQMFGLEDRVTPADLTCDLPTLLCDCPIFPAALVRRSAVISVGGYDEGLNGDEDWDLWISLLEGGNRGTILPDILFFYRRRAGSLCDQCTRGQTRLDHLAFLMNKHRQSYEQHLPFVLSNKECEIAEQIRKNRALGAEVHEVLLATIERRRAELAHLKAVHGQRTAAIDALRHEYERSRAEVEALRRSASWRVTAPLRAVYEVLCQIRQGRRR